MEYRYRAKDREGKSVRGVIGAEDEDALFEELRAQDLVLVEVAPAARTEVRGTGRVRVRSRDVLNFTTDLSTVLGSGIPISEGLQDLAQGADRMQPIIENILNNIGAGASLSNALEQYPKIFDRLYVSIIRAGESSGNLDRVLADLGAFLEWKSDLRREVTQALIYPAMVLLTMGGLVTLLATFVFPQFKKVLGPSMATLPLPTRILFFISDFLRDDWYVLVVAAVALPLGLGLWLRTSTGAALFDRFKLKVPVVGSLVQDIALSRFCHFFSVLFGAGVDISETLTIVEAVVGNSVLAGATRAVRSEVRAGNSLSQSLAATGYFPAMVVRLFHIGETSGQLTSALQKITHYYDKQIPATIKKVFSILEPLLYVFLAVIVLTVGLGIYMPLYQMVSTVSKGR